MDIQSLLSEPGKLWRGQPGATEEQIRLLIENIPIQLPDELLDLLRYTNGGEGALDLPPLWLQLFSVDLIIDTTSVPYLREYYPDFFVFAGNGGMEDIAFDLRKSAPPWPVVMIDPVCGAEGIIEIAPDITTFIKAIGIDNTRE